MRAVLSCLALSFVVGNVVDLRHNTFDDFLASKKPTFVKFFAPWCTHCQHLAPIYDEVAATIGEEVAMARVDCTDAFDTSVCGRFGVKGFPTLMMIRWVEDPAMLALTEDLPEGHAHDHNSGQVPKLEDAKALQEQQAKEDRAKLLEPGLRVFRYMGARTKEDITNWLQTAWKETKPVRFPSKTESLSEPPEDFMSFITNHPYLSALYLLSIVAVVGGFGYILCDAWRSPSEGPEDEDDSVALVPVPTTTTAPKPPAGPSPNDKNAVPEGGKAGQGLTQRKPSKPENT